MENSNNSFEYAVPRIGHGYDVHRLTENRRLILGGIEIPYEKGLLGHSDADVLTHAVMDSVLGAASLGDIGRHFPDTSEKYKDIDSLKLASDVYKLISDRGYCIGNIDATIIAQRPKLSPYIDMMRKKLANVFNVSETAINIKATTEEGLGFTGNGDAIAAHSVAILIRKYV